MGNRSRVGTMKPETQFWNYIRPRMKGRWYATRIETYTENGVPDVTFTVDGFHGWIELKYLKEFPKRETTIVKIPHYTDLQRYFLSTRGKAAGHCYLLIKVNREYFLFDYEQAQSVGVSFTKKDFVENSKFYWKNKIDFEELRKAL